MSSWREEGREREGGIEGRERDYPHVRSLEFRALTKINTDSHWLITHA